MANKFYVHNDIFRYEDEVFGDSEAELEGEPWTCVSEKCCLLLAKRSLHDKGKVTAGRFATTSNGGERQVFSSVFPFLESEEEVEEEQEERQPTPEPLQDSPRSTTYYEQHPVT